MMRPCYCISYNSHWSCKEMDRQTIPRNNQHLQEGDETLYQAWERYNDLLYKCPTHDLNSHQKVNIFYKGLDTMTRQLLDSQGLIPNKTPTQALVAIQTMADHLQKWNDGSTSRRITNDSLDGIAAIMSKLDSLGRDMRS
ncbi:hypothetical protein Tco_0241239 [Tanacetum coccineum]